MERLGSSENVSGEVEVLLRLLKQPGMGRNKRESDLLNKRRVFHILRDEAGSIPGTESVGADVVNEYFWIIFGD